MFARYCEDNQLVRPLWIAGHTREHRQRALDARNAYFHDNPEHNDRDWLKTIVVYFADHPAMAALVDRYNPLHQVSPSGDAALKLLEFWWETDSAGTLLRTYAGHGTRFLGDLYEALSEAAQKKYALRQTPEFVEEFILDQTLEPALEERPLDGFRLIDPTCGSGHFLLGAFARLHDRWQKKAPNESRRTLVQNALNSIYGVDINPFAIAIARFRLIVAALNATNENSLDNAPDYHLNLTCGDSLIFGAPQQALSNDLLSIDETIFTYSIECHPTLERFLQDNRGTYDAVVGNPPYITVKDKSLNRAYRESFNTCHGKYQLTVPFMELFFILARNGERPGWTGQITSNAFMKREFGKPLIEEFLSRVDLRAVIDTSGAYIPGHATPTVIIIGRNQSPKTSAVRAVLRVRGEPRPPSVAADGFVWRSIADHIKEPGFKNDWINVTDVDRQFFSSFPWSLSGGGAAELVSNIEDATSRILVHEIAGRIGFASFPGADDVFFSPRHALVADGIASELMRPLIVGEYVRDWALKVDEWAFVPYGTATDLVEKDSESDWYRRQWRYRATVRETIGISEETLVSPENPFWSWYRWIPERYQIPLSITFAEVATHNHFALDRGGRVFNQTAPVIKLPSGASEDDHLAIMGALNSSTVSFWLKQVCFDKGNGGIGRGISDEEWEHRFAFNGSKVKLCPIPNVLPLKLARALDSLAQNLAKLDPVAVCEGCTPTRERLDQARGEHERIRGRMIALQEELDWLCYRLYGLMHEDLTYGGDVPEVMLGERAFEIVLAREVAAGDEETAWFERHRSTPVTDVPGNWSEDYQKLVQRRLEVIVDNKNIRLLERPEYKRRWASEPWEKRVQVALRNWLLDRLEDGRLWFDRHGRPRPRSVAQLADEVGRDDGFVSVLEMWVGRPDVSVVDSLGKLLGDQAVPYLAAYRHKPAGLEKRAAWEETWALQRKEDAGDTLDRPIPVPPTYKDTDFARKEYWAHRGKLDVPKERFILYPEAGRETDATALLGWSGWDHAQQALAIATIMNEREAEGWDDARLVPMIAGLVELQPWVHQWHGEIDPTYGVSLATFFDEEIAARAQRAGKTVEEITAWRSEPTRRGRQRKTAS